MSDTTIDTAPTRRPRGERSESKREESPEPQVTIETIEPVVAAPSEADNALADTRRLLKQAEDDRNAATARARAADAARATAERNASSNRLNDRAGTVHATLEAGKNEVTAAKVAYAAARESGDVSAEIAAQEMLASATFKVRESSRELEWLQAQAQQTQTTPQDQGQGYTPSSAAQKWIDDHPLYSQPNSVSGARAYKALAQALHSEALQAGHPDGSDQYIQYIDRGMTDELGEGHGQVGGRSKSVDRNEDQPMRGGEGMRPSSGGSSDGAGWTTARIPLGHMGAMATIKYRGPPENRRIQFARPEDMENFKEGAAVSYRALFEKDPNRALAEFVNEHIEAHNEGYADMKTGDGQGYR